ncbi:hypothetical protein SORBI_3010G136250, partial [Sorghum bicolor]
GFCNGELLRRRRGELLQLAHTLRLVRPPVVWVVVEPAADAPATAEVLRGTGVLYRHRLAGVLHFADAAGVYDVGFFDQIRQIELQKHFHFCIDFLSANGKNGHFLITVI